MPAALRTEVARWLQLRTRSRPKTIQVDVTLAASADPFRRFFTEARLVHHHAWLREARAPDGVDACSWNALTVGPVSFTCMFPAPSGLPTRIAIKAQEASDPMGVDFGLLQDARTSSESTRSRICRQCVPSQNTRPQPSQALKRSCRSHTPGGNSEATRAFSTECNTELQLRQRVKGRAERARSSR